MFAPLVGLGSEVLQQHRAPVDEHAGVAEGQALLGALGTQEGDERGQGGLVVVRAADEGLQDVVGGALRMTVVIQRVGFKEEVEQDLEVGWKERWVQLAGGFLPSQCAA